MPALLTTARNPDAGLRALCRELAEEFGARCAQRSSRSIEKLAEYARCEGFTSLCIISGRGARHSARVLEISERGWKDLFHAELNSAAARKLAVLAGKRGALNGQIQNCI